MNNNKKMQLYERNFCLFPCFSQKNHKICTIRNRNGRIFHNKMEDFPFILYQIKPQQNGKGKRLQSVKSGSR